MPPNIGFQPQYIVVALVAILFMVLFVAALFKNTGQENKQEDNNVNSDK